jgi:hypothetical protein
VFEKTEPLYLSICRHACFRRPTPRQCSFVHIYICASACTPIYKATFSFPQNLSAERKWPEVNQRVLYPIKEILVRMENRLQINRYDPISQFCVSFITLNVVNVGIGRVVAAWNSHPIEGLHQISPRS